MEAGAATGGGSGVGGGAGSTSVAAATDGTEAMSPKVALNPGPVAFPVSAGGGRAAGGGGGGCGCGTVIGGRAGGTSVQAGTGRVTRKVTFTVLVAHAYYHR